MNIPIVPHSWTIPACEFLFCSPDFQVEVEPIPAKDAEILADYEEQQIVVGSKWHPFLVIDHGWKIHENPTFIDVFPS